MHFRILIMMWRRKFFVMGCIAMLIVAIWGWATFSLLGSTNNNDGNKVMSVRDLEPGGKHESLWEKLTIFNPHQNTDEDNNGVKFVKPTSSDSSSHQTKTERILDGLFSDKYIDKLRNLKMPDRDEIAWRRTAMDQKAAIDKQSHYEHELQRMGAPVVTGLGPGGPPPPNQRLVHLDLKGAPPKITYLKRLMPILKSLGATGILLEYEDMFPYSGAIASIAARNSYSKKDLLDLLHTAASTGLSIMPLVQTFGHLEYVLKLREYQHMREVPESPQSICPSLNESLIFIEEMLSQVINLHMGMGDSVGKIEINDGQDGDIYVSTVPQFTHIHIGCDEVYRMGECPRCKSKTKHDLFIAHVTAVANKIKTRWPSLNVVIWDDMMRQIKLIDLQDSKLGSLVEPMIWAYAEDVYRFVTPQTFDKYATVFPTVWAASAFKGAHGETLLIPPSRRHLENTLKWLTVIQSETHRFSKGIQGLALTGWQRYDHFSVLCEMLPTSLPSLAVCLSTASRGYFDVDGKRNPILSALSCPDRSPDSFNKRPWIDWHQDPDLSFFSWCMFPGSTLFRFSHRLFTAFAETKEYLDTVKYKRSGLMDYNIKHNFTSTVRVNELVDQASKLKMSLIHLAKNASDVMIDIYDKFTIEEFIEQRINPLVDELNNILNHASHLVTFKVWPRRPLPYIRVLQEFDTQTTDKDKSK